MTKIFGKRLKELRKAQGLFQSDLAEELKVSQQSIADWENGKTEPNFERVLAISDFFKTSPNFLLGYDGGEKRI